MQKKISENSAYLIMHECHRFDEKALALSEYLLNKHRGISIFVAKISKFEKCEYGFVLNGKLLFDDKYKNYIENTNYIFALLDHRDIADNLRVKKFIKSNKINAKYLIKSVVHLQKYFDDPLTYPDPPSLNLLKSTKSGLSAKFKIYLLYCFYLFVKGLRSLSPKPAGGGDVLIIKFDVFGDMVVALPYLRALKRAYEPASVTIMLSSKGAAYLRAYEAFSGERVFEKQLVWDAPWHYRRVLSLGLRDFWFTLGGLLKLYRQRFSRVIQCREHGITIWLALMMTRGKVTSIYDGKLPLARLLGIHLERKIDVTSLEMHHMVDFPRLVLRSCLGRDVPVDDIYLRGECLGSTSLPTAWRDNGAVRILINIGAGMPLRRWGADRYAQLHDLIKHDLGVSSVLLCGPDEAPFYDDVANACETAPEGFPGTLELTDVMTLVGSSDIIISPDTGIMHLAAAFNKKIVALFGAGEIDFCRPLNEQHVIVRRELGCSGCGDKCFTDTIPPPCLDAITVREVFESLLTLYHGASDEKNPVASS